MGVGVSMRSDNGEASTFGKGTRIPNKFYGCFQNILVSACLNLSSPYKSKGKKDSSARKGILCDRSMGFTVPKSIFL